MPAPGPNAALRVPPLCNRCQINRVAWSSPRVDFCYACLPGGPFDTPPCRTCGGHDDYFSQGLCDLCHPRSPEHIGACKHCLAWGVYPRYNWTCWSCKWWEGHYSLGTCRYCDRDTYIGEQHACRLCLENARLEQTPGRAPDVAAANAHSQQLFFANMVNRRRKAMLPDYVTWDGRWSKRNKNQLPYPPGTGFDGPAEQLVLFDMAPDPAALRQRILIEDSDLTRFCAAILADHSTRYGWSVRQRNGVMQTLRMLQVIRPTPTAKIRASDVVFLRRYDGTIISTIDVLAEAGLLIEDVPTHIERYFDAKFIATGHLPKQMRQHLELWLQIMLGGSRNSPRQLPRDPETVENHIRGLVPVVELWVEAGHTSFAEITPDDVAQAMAHVRANGAPTMQHHTTAGLKSLYRVLKGRRLVFVNPTRGMPLRPMDGTIPLPLDTELIRAELESPNPAVALGIALVAFHGLTGKQVRELLLTDIVDGRLALGDRQIPLAAPVRTRLVAWLDHRARKWPRSINPHLLINQRNAPRLTGAGFGYPFRMSAVKPRELRQDRILHELHATGGDLRRICDLFGLSVSGATRYLYTVEHADLATADHQRI